MSKNHLENWDKSELIEEIQKLRKRKKYGIVWDEERTKEKFEKDAEGKLPVLKEIREKEIQTEPTKPINILIEGDNFHALSVLNYTHKNSLDLIYIDPPYNTGNEGFRYNDDIVDINDSYRHSKWLSFLSKRLKLAKNLLKNTGAIFISIDDNEVAQLKLLCNEIFGEENFISQIVVQVNKGGRDYLPIATTHEYLLCYGKSSETNLNELPKDMTVFEQQDKKGPYELRELRNRNPKFNRENRPNLYYPIYVNSEVKDEYDCCPISLEKTKKFSIEVFPKNSEGKDSCWRWGRQLLSKNISLNDPQGSQAVARQKKDGGWNIYEKSRKFTTKAKSIWDDSDVRTEMGTIILRSIFGKSVFDHPKPVPLIKKVLRLATNKDSVILDFFAGSGTTVHASLELNNEDNGYRKVILCTNNENEICSEVCYPRIEKVINGWKSEKNGQVKGLGGNLKYFRTSFVDSEPTDRNKRILVNQSTEMLCLKEDCFDRVHEGKNYKIFTNKNKRYLGIIYDDDGIENFKKEIHKMKTKINVYVFSLDESAREEEFMGVENWVNLKPIPEVILNVYRRIFK